MQDDGYITWNEWGDQDLWFRGKEEYQRARHTAISWKWVWNNGPEKRWKGELEETGKQLRVRKTRLQVLDWLCWWDEHNLIWSYIENDASFVSIWVPMKSLPKFFSGISQIIIDQVFIRTSLWRRHNCVRESLT